MCKRYWYSYNGTGSDQVPGSYLAPTFLEPYCAGGFTSCAIYVCGGGINPTRGAITNNIKAYLAKAKAFQYPSYPLVCQQYMTSRI